MRKYILMLLSVLSLFSCEKQQQYTEASIKFHWFEYRGKDEIFESPKPATLYRNPIIAGFYPDPSLVRVENDYYLTNSTFAYTPGLPIFHSTDLVNWHLIGHALTRRSQLTLENGQDISRGIFAPTLRYHKGLFYIITTDVDGIGNFFITASDPAGPWSDPVLLPEIQGIDPDIFFDDDGKVYIAHNDAPNEPPRYDGHRAIWLWEYDLANQQVVTDSGKVIVNGGVDISKKPVWIEAPHLYKLNGWYYLSCAEGGTSTEHSQVVFRTRNLNEPFIAYENNPILTQRNLPPDRSSAVSSTGHADFVQTQNGEWWVVFLGVRPYSKEFFNTGRETFLLPVRWENDWPVILENNTALPELVTRPRLPYEQNASSPTNGNFRWRDDFQTRELRPEWLKVRTSPVNWHKLDSINSTLQLKALSNSLSGDKQPVYFGRRQQHTSFNASAKLNIPTHAGISAGIALFQNAKHHIFLGVKNTQGKTEVFLEQTIGGNTIELNSVRENSSNQIVLKVEQITDKISFYVLKNDGTQALIASNVDAKTLSTNVAGGFVGATVGIHARKDG